MPALNGADDEGIDSWALLTAVVEGDGSGDADLVSGDAALEEVGQFLDVLQVHEGQRVRGAVQRLDAELG